MGNRETAQAHPLQWRFDEWNSGVRRARQAYDVLLDEQESPNRHDMDPPPVCLLRLHGIRVAADVVRSPGGRWWCVRCQQASARRRRGERTQGSAYRLTPELDKEIRDRYEAGESAQLIAPDFGVAPITILKAVRRAGGRIRTRQEADEARLRRAA